MAKLTKNEKYIVEMYVRYFGKAPTKAQIDEYAEVGKPKEILKQITGDANDAKPSNITYDDYIDSIFQNLFGRPASGPEKTKYAKTYDKKGDLPINSIVKSAKKSDKDVYKNKIEVADKYAELGGKDDLDLSKISKGNLIDLNFLNTVTKAADLQAKVDALPENNGVPSAFDGKTFTLTASADTGKDFVGTAKDDTFLSASTNHWGVGDSIDGGKGVDKLKIIDNGAITQADVIPTGSTIKNVEILDIISGSTVIADTTSIDGVTHLSTISTGGNTSTAAATTDVNATNTDAATTAEAIAVNGGKNVTVVSKNNILDTITVGGTAAAPTVAAAEKVSVTSTGADVAAGVTLGAITVTGGTEITVNQYAGKAAGTGTNLGGTVTVTGNASTTTVTVNQTATAAGAAATPTAAAVVGYTAGGVTINDAKAGSATAAATISTVTLNNYGASTISSNALSTLNLSGTAGTLGLTTGLTTPTNTTLTMNLNKLSGTNTITDSTAAAGAGYKTLNVNSSTADSTLVALAFADVETLNVSGDAKLTITGANTLTAVKDIVVTNTAGFDLGTAAIGATVNFTGGAGNDSVKLSNSFTKAITMGAGNDKVTVGGTTIGTGGSVDAGEGNDTIVMAVADAATFDNDSTFNTKFKGFETLELNTITGGSAENIDLNGINGVSTVNLAAAVSQTGGLTLTNLVSNGKVRVTNDVTTALTIVVKDALLTNTDVLNLELSKTGVVLAAGSITAANVETININVADAATLGSAAVTHTANLTLADATTIAVAGNNGLDLSTSAAFTKVTNFDASGVVANGTADTAANLAVTFTSGNATATANVTIKGGAGNDTLTGNAAIDTITGGAGNDTLAGAGGADIINVGEGRDVVVIGATDSTTASFDSINGFTLATKATAIFTNQAGFLGGTTGGSNVSILDITPAVTIAANTATAQAGQGAGVTYTIKDGILTVGGAGASTVDTLGEWFTEANAALGGVAGASIAFEFGSDTYVYTENAGTDILVKLVGVTGANALVDGYSAATTVDNTILIG